jgi:hypothetical protein
MDEAFTHRWHELLMFTQGLTLPVDEQLSVKHGSGCLRTLLAKTHHDVDIGFGRC